VFSVTAALVIGNDTEVSVMVLLRARALLAGLADAAPPPRRSSITWRLHRAEELGSDNFPAIWRHAAGGDPG
jgi:hypothetical protein